LPGSEYKIGFSFASGMKTRPQPNTWCPEDINTTIRPRQPGFGPVPVCPVLPNLRSAQCKSYNARS